MKNVRIQLIAIGLALISSLFLITCKKDEAKDQEQEIAFSIGLLDSGSKLKSAQLNSFDNVRRIIVSIKQFDNTPTRYNSTRMEVYKLNGELLSPKIVLKKGMYYITELLLLDSLDNTIFVTPKVGSTEQHKVGTPLPYFFAVEDASYCRVEVTTTEGKQPADFGLAGFSISENTCLDFQVAVNDLVTGNYISAKLNVLSGKYCYTQELKASSTNLVTVLDKYDSYELTIEKKGYKTYQHTFSVDSLRLFNGKEKNVPLFVELEKENILNLKDSVVDIEGNVYKTIRIGNQNWMAENLRVTKYNNGTPIPNVTDDVKWSKMETPAYCWYNNNQSTFKKNYGALYNVYTIQKNNVCPSGWHAPNAEEWNIMIEFLDGDDIAGAKLKELGIVALPTGSRNADGYFSGIDEYYNWWGPKSSDPNSSWMFQMVNNLDYLHGGGSSMACGFAVRCIKD